MKELLPVFIPRLVGLLMGTALGLTIKDNKKN